LAKTRTSSSRSADEPAIIVTPDGLRTIAGDSYFERGEAYFERGQVHSLFGRERGVMATVRGTHDYHVRLTIEDGEVDGSCSCPLGSDGSFCKHCVATGLAWHAAIAEGRALFDGEADVEGYLGTLDKAELIRIILERAQADPRLDRMLTLSAAQATGGPEAAETWMRAFDDALEQTFDGAYGSSDWLYDDNESYADELMDTVKALDVMLRSGDADQVVGYTEYAMERIGVAMEDADGMDGFLDGAFDRLADLHLEACTLARLDAADLAKRLIDLSITAGWAYLDNAYATYADPLGAGGRAEYRRLALALWADQREAAGHNALAAIVEAIALADGDTDMLVDVKSRDLRWASDFLVLARAFDEAGNADGALAWAERGWERFADSYYERELHDYLVDAYQLRDRHDEAMALVWESFDRDPCLPAYRDLERHAGLARQWPRWREQALSLIRRQIAGEDDRPRPLRFGQAADNSLLVEIFLHEDDPDAAWREAADGGCSPELWLALAARRKQTHPHDSVDIYRRHAEFMLQSTGGHAYREAVKAMAAIEAICLDRDEVEVFPELVARIRKEHKRKRKLMGMMDDRGW
jgi:uncharacterized Zn finger protein